MKAKLGIAPIAWWNDDLPELSDDVSLEECLRQAREAGFTVMETGRRFPMDAAVLEPILKQHGMGDRGTPLAMRPRLDEDQIKAYGRKLTAFGEWCADQGMPISYHHHMAAPIESEEDVDLLMKHSGEGLPLLYDAGHM